MISFMYILHTSIHKCISVHKHTNIQKAKNSLLEYKHKAAIPIELSNFLQDVFEAFGVLMVASQHLFIRYNLNTYIKKH